MLKIYKSQSYSYGASQPVKIDNTVILPGEENVGQEAPSREELEQQKQREAAAKEAEFRAAVDRQVAAAVEDYRIRTEAARREIIENAKLEAKSIAEDAKTATAAVIEKANKECAILKEKAKAEGFKEGYDEGKKQSLEKCRKYVSTASLRYKFAQGRVLPRQRERNARNDVRNA